MAHPSMCRTNSGRNVVEVRASGELVKLNHFNPLPRRSHGVQMDDYLHELLSRAQLGTLGSAGWRDLYDLIRDLRWKAEEQADIITTLERRLRKVGS